VVFAANIHLDKATPQGACSYSVHEKSKCNIAAFGNHTGVDDLIKYVGHCLSVDRGGIENWPRSASD